MKPTTLEFKPQERNIFFHVLTGCNLSCKHCYINTDQHGKEMVSRNTMETWLKLFYEPTKDTNVIFLGGEPTMHKDLAHGVKFARELGYATVTIDTNGYVFHDILERIEPHEAVISFSLDGPDAEINDPIRGRGVFATCTAGIKKAVKKGFDVSLIYTVSSMNLAHLQRMPALLEELGVKRFFIQVIGIRGKSATTTERLQVTPDEWLTIIPQVAADAANRDIHVIYPKVFLDPNEPFVCAGQLAQNFFIFPNGRVYQCPLCEDFPLHTYDIKNNTLHRNSGLSEAQLFTLEIPEGCVMNKLLQPGNLEYLEDGTVKHRISCCLLKQEMQL
ncbi:MAG: radical SAM protein [Desulfobulbaceae bacterium]|jgi:MoaA/NifB/PqqE/SkfB family radical SAM enzyme|nr:radical SAM protein [Desulfobulbaceae bacterium]